MDLTVFVRLFASIIKKDYAMERLDTIARLSSCTNCAGLKNLNESSGIAYSVRHLG